MENDINKPIVKEGTIIQGCSTGHHSFNSSKSMLGTHNGILEMRVKCVLCGIEVAEPIPGLGESLPPESIPQDDGVVPEQILERGVPVGDKTKESESEVKFDDPMEEIRQQPFADPVWANDVRERYKHDKNLDNFWRDIWDKAKSRN